MKIFNRLPIKERGHFSNYFTLFPVQRIEFNKSVIRITCRGKVNKYRINELKAEIHKKYCAKAYGAAAHVFIKQNLITLTSSRHSYTFDLSKQFPDFEEPNIILKFIEKNINCTYKRTSLKEIKKNQVKTSVILISVFLVLLVGLKINDI